MVATMRHFSMISAALLTLSAPLFASCSDSSSGPEDSGTQPVGAASGRIFASVSAAGEVVVLDEESHQQVGAIPVGKGPAILVGTPDRSKLYSANWGDDTVSAIDAEALSAHAIAMPGRPYVIAISPDGKRLYAGCSGTNEIVVIDTADDTVLRSFVMPELPASIIVSADGATLYVATLGSVIPGIGAPGSIMAVSAEDGEVEREPIAVGNVPAWITMRPDGRKVYTLNFLSDDISVVDTASWKVEATIEMGTGTQSIIGNVTPDGSTLYVTNFGSAELVAIDTSTNQITRTTKLDGKPVGVHFNADGSRVYVTDFGTQSIGQNPLVGLEYLLTGVYNGGGTGQVRAFDTASGAPVGAIASTGPGATSVIVRPAQAD